ncbi:HAMP domain-containing histidine kinase [Nocardia beijingensis]|uniref:sensor histidine kinase n=1 Tax=Nocardia beijingensis TaxID=95162 RepID=UPI0018946375|nr:HAMP domain-containing sensor histidine kinase [Nocardia beijingensis]MBF6467209.1 HAMP domain-containing histidine kinase [Nocardia beijingensis]
MSRSPSLRTRVAVVSGVVAALVALTLTITFAALLDATGERQLDETVSSMAVRVAGPREAVPAQPVPPAVSTVSPLSPGRAPADAGGPGAPADAAIARVDGLPGVLVALDPDRDVVASAIHRSQRIGFGIGVAGALLAALLGWFLAGFAARPLRRLADATHRIDTLEVLPPLSGRGAREAEELSDAITRMLARLEAAHRATQRALSGARDFASVCAHELRTPLTALRTDLQVLATKEIPEEQRGAILSEVLLAERQIENTLTDLERLALGELTEPDVFESFDLCDTLDRAVHDARRRHPGVDVRLAECAPVTVTGLPGGVLLIVTNAVANAVQHGRARTVTVTARSGPEDTVEIHVDDDGHGIPEALRADAFDRFVKGPGSPGSGLGLALVRQQAELHSGTAELDESPVGGARLRVRLRTAG